MVAECSSQQRGCCHWGWGEVAMRGVRCEPATMSQGSWNHATARGNMQAICGSGGDRQWQMLQPRRELQASTASYEELRGRDMRQCTMSKKASTSTMFLRPVRRADGASTAVGFSSSRSASSGAAKGGMLPPACIAELRGMLLQAVLQEEPRQGRGSVARRARI